MTKKRKETAHKKVILRTRQTNSIFNAFGRESRVIEVLGHPHKHELFCHLTFDIPAMLLYNPLQLNWGRRKHDFMLSIHFYELVLSHG
jgi:hypothetical protein